MLVSRKNEQVLAMSETLYDAAQDTSLHRARNREYGDFPYEKQKSGADSSTSRYALRSE
jgi:hypothetical protein